MASGVFFIVASFLGFFSRVWVSPVSLPSHPSFLCILSFFITFCRDVLSMPTWCLITIGDIHRDLVFSLTTASVGARVFSRLARSRKINLTVPSGSASWPISAIHWHAYSIWDTLFSVLASIPHSLFGSHLAAANYPSLCVVSLLLSMSLCVPVYVERELTSQYALNCAWVIMKRETGAQENYNVQSHKS